MKLSTLVSLLVAFNICHAVTIEYEVELHCPIADRWCFEVSFYELDKTWDKYLAWHEPICSRFMKSGVVMNVTFTFGWAEIDGWFEPEIRITHNCSMHPDHTHYMRKALPYVGTLPPNYGKDSVKLYINDYGDRYEYPFVPSYFHEYKRTY